MSRPIKGHVINNRTLFLPQHPASRRVERLVLQRVRRGCTSGSVLASKDHSLTFHRGSIEHPSLDETSSCFGLMFEINFKHVT